MQSLSIRNLNMARGKQRDKEKTIELLEPYFKLGASVTKACNYAGISSSTVLTWIMNDEVLRAKITLWQNELTVAARKTVARELLKHDSSISTAMEWLRAKEKAEFSSRTEVTGEDGAPLGGLSDTDRAALTKLHDILGQ